MTLGEVKDLISRYHGSKSKFINLSVVKESLVIRYRPEVITSHIAEHISPQTQTLPISYSINSETHTLSLRIGKSHTNIKYKELTQSQLDDLLVNFQLTTLNTILPKEKVNADERYSI